MRWRRRWSERQSAPALRKLSEEQKKRALAVLSKGIECSPVLTHLGIRTRALRGRFYIERLWPCPEGKPEVEPIGWLSPLASQERTFLLEAPKGGGSWFQVANGTTKKLIDLVAGDTIGTFHGLGALDSGLRKAGEGTERREAEVRDSRFVWEAFRIRPKCSKSIATALEWLDKRKWREWSW